MLTLTHIKSVAVAVAVVMVICLGQDCGAQQSTSGNCSPAIINGNGVVNLNCPPSDKDKILNEQEKWEAQRVLEEKKIEYMRNNGGCPLGTHHFCQDIYSSGVNGRVKIGSAGCFCAAN